MDNGLLPTSTPTGRLTPNTIEDDRTIAAEEKDGAKSPLKESPTIETTEHIEDVYLSGWKLALVFGSMLLTVFLVALDQTIVATALPRIASEFNALESVTWLASAYFLTQAGLMLTYGQALKEMNTKYVYLFAILLFEVGSAICGAAPSVNVLIFGRAVAGAGAAGIFVAVLAITARITRIEQRAALFGLFAAMYALASVAGPLMGGAFTDHVSWRWSFYINLPLGAVALPLIVVLIKRKHSSVMIANPAPVWKRLLNLDWIGTALALGMVTSLLLPLQWGGVTKPWNDKSVIALFVVFGVLVPMFIGWEWYKGESAMMPLRLFKNRTQIGASIEAAMLMLAFLLAVFYLPLYYQSAMEHSATRSGIDILVFMITAIVASIGAGGIINMTGRPLPWLVIAPLLATVGSGLMYWALRFSPKSATILGLQALLGIGLGASFNNTIIAIQAEYNDEPEMVPQATSALNFLQLTGGIIGIAVAGTIFGNRLTSSIAMYAPDLSPDVAKAARQSVEVIYTLQGADKLAVIRAYSESLGYTFILGIPATIIASMAALLIKNHDLKALGVKAEAGVAA